MREIKKTFVFAAMLLASTSAYAAEKADLVIVKKSESRLYLQRDGKIFATFKATFGADPKGHKRQEGDERTPEGRYVLDAKNSKSAFYKAIHISYPNDQDIASAKTQGVSPGSAIMVHGQKNGFGWLAPVARWVNWTDGCVAVSDKDMDKIWSAVDVGTPIEIYPENLHSKTLVKHMNWEMLVEVLARCVPAGTITTYKEVSLWAYGEPNRNHPVRALLTGAANHGHLLLTNRVVRSDGALADIPEGQEQQRDQLVREGVSFTASGNVDLQLYMPALLGRYSGDHA